MPTIFCHLSLKLFTTPLVNEKTFFSLGLPIFNGPSNHLVMKWYKKIPKLETARYWTHIILCLASGTLYRVRFEFKVEGTELIHVEVFAGLFVCVFLKKKSLTGYFCFSDKNINKTISQSRGACFITNIPYLYWATRNRELFFKHVIF